MQKRKEKSLYGYFDMLIIQPEGVFYEEEIVIHDVCHGTDVIGLYPD